MVKFIGSYGATARLFIPSESYHDASGNFGAFVQKIVVEIPSRGFAFLPSIEGSPNVAAVTTTVSTVAATSISLISKLMIMFTVVLTV